MIEQDRQQDSFEILEQLTELREKQADLLSRLSRSTLIQTLVPDAFEHGRCVSYVVGNPWHPNRMQWVVRRGDGSRRVFPLLTIPETLWGEFTRESARETTRGSVKEWR